MNRTDARTVVGRAIGSGVRLGRGTADRAIRVAGPRMAAVLGEVTSRFRRGRNGLPTTETFAPSRPDGEGTAAPSPASVARNIAPQRPTASPARKAATAKSAPGAKLPPRPRTT